MLAVNSESMPNVVAWKNFPRALGLVLFSIILLGTNNKERILEDFYNVILVSAFVWLLTNYLPFLRDAYFRNFFPFLAIIVYPVSLWFPLRWIFALVCGFISYLGGTNLIVILITLGPFLVFDFIRVFIVRPNYKPKAYL
jgi:hypothetical protein